MYTDEQFEKLEQEERVITDEAIAVMILLLASAKSELVKELKNFYSTYGKDGVVTYSEARKWSSENDHRRRLTVLLLYLNEHFNELYTNLSPHFKEMLLAVIGKESEFFDAEVDEKVADKQWGADEKNWDERLIDDVALWVAYLTMDIKRGLTQRKHINEVIKQIDKRFATMEYVITTLGLSESTAVGSMARQEIFKKLGITKYQFFTKVDERRCDVCGSMHGLIFPISAFEVGVTASPLHPRCRCWEVPIRD